ncbi:hypothetical protein DPMN_039700 [Dreissena polymorpha]|uniref:Uncharacterized protein n=1 Tax=Dreissena polymorpha TaxID=45954 RepID=A0A9D4CUL6_DREPO|nr:hypothetical protein DPMN_039700 [Dreissena polymorpha]
MGGKTTKEPPVIAAIDFGTTFTGYAFKFASNDTIYTDVRVPTCVLLRPDKTLRAFGNYAVEEYEKMLSLEDQKSHFYFRNFKMLLYKTESRDVNATIADAKGKDMEALEVFKIVLEHIQNKILQDIKTKKYFDKPVPDKEVQWIITVPAIWSDFSRNFMRKAAESAGFIPGKTRLVLEPEAASAFVRRQNTVIKRNACVPFEKGHRYIIADLGGGTIDICAHEILDNGRVTELCRPCGDYGGGTVVDQEFSNFLVKMYGGEVVEKFKTDDRLTFVDLLRDFENIKSMFSNSTQMVVINLGGLTKLYQDREKESTSEMLERSLYGKKVNLHDNKTHWYLSNEIMKEFFEKSRSAIFKNMKEIVEECKKQDKPIQSIMLAGGLSESPYIQECIRQEFEGKLQVICADEGRLSVVKGAVILGCMPRDHITRKAPYTYGFYQIRPFDSKRHDKALCITHNKVKQCDKLFYKLIEKGQTMHHNESFAVEGEITIQDDNLKTKIRHMSLWRSSLTDPKYCLPNKENQAQIVAKIDIAPPEGGWPRTLEHVQRLIVDDNEFVIKFVNKNTNKELNTTVTYVNN